MLRSSPNEDHPYFKNVPETPTTVRFLSPNVEVIKTFSQANHTRVLHQDDNPEYDADTEDTDSRLPMKTTTFHHRRDRFSKLPVRALPQMHLTDKESAHSSFVVYRK